MQAMNVPTKIFLWAICWSICISILKILIFVILNFNLTPSYIYGSIISIFGNIVIGTFIGFLIYSRSWFFRQFGFLVSTVTFLFYVASFHYEVIFRNLPGPALFYYLKEVHHLMPSIKSNVPFFLLVLEIISLMTLIFGGKIFIKFLKNKFRFKDKYPFNMIAVAISVLISFGVHLKPSGPVGDSFYWGSRNPIFWLIHSSMVKTGYNHVSLMPQQIWKFQEEIGQVIPRGGKNDLYPLWTGFRKVNSSNFKKHSFILLILESVGNKEMFMEVNGKLLMPNLLKIAKNNLFFKNISAGGTKSNQILPSIFCGVPPQTHSNILWKKPLPKVDGLPDLLRNRGYLTAYFHGSDLSFEQQRSFLKMIGFDYIMDYDPKLEKKVRGWGYDDREMFSILRNWVTQQSNVDEPYFATLFTLSTHDPYILPRDWQRIFTEKHPTIRDNGTWIGATKTKDRYKLFLESLAFLDQEIGLFYDWYLANEKSKGTILVILGDHITALHNEVYHNKNIRFFVPLIFAGLPQKKIHFYKKYLDRRGSLYDLPATLTGYLKLDPVSCDQGLNLFMRESFWPKDRLIYAVAGHNLDKLYFWTNNVQLSYDRMKNTFHIINNEITNRDFLANKKKVKEIIKRRILPFMYILLKLNKYLITKNSYMPLYNYNIEKMMPLTKVNIPIFVSHRGNTNGMRIHIEQNKGSAIEDAINKGFKWVELDVRLTKDGVPVLIHNANIHDSKGNSLKIKELDFPEIKNIPGYTDLLTLEEALTRYLDRINIALEIKPEQLIDRNLVLNRKVLKIIQKNPLKHKIIIDSFSEMSAKYIKTRCNCDVGIDTPYREPITKNTLDFISFSGLDWVYVHKSVANKTLIQNAHDAGLKVMVYTVNDSSILKKWLRNPPDGIITDRIQLKQEYESIF